MTKFANLPDDCYFLIFTRLSTSTLLSCRRVSRAWLRNQQEVCRHRKALILLQGNSPVQLLLTKAHFQGPFISHEIDAKNGQPADFVQFVLANRVNLASFDHNVTRFLAKTFPNVNTLIVVHDDISAHNCQTANKPLIGLLQLYTTQIVTLGMYFNYRDELDQVIDPNIVKVIHQLNSMTALEHVTLETHNHAGLALKMADYNDFIFLTRIKHFYYYSKDAPTGWIEVLRQLEPNVSRLEQIGIDSLWCVQPMEHWPLASRFTHFPGSRSRLHFNRVTLEKSIGQFGSLTTFSIDDHRSRSIFRQLATLSQHCPALLHISIKIMRSDDDMFAHPFDPSTIKPFECLKALDLAFWNYDSTENNFHAHVRPLVHTFPCLFSIKITNSFQRPSLNVLFGTFFRQLKSAFGRETLRTDYSVNQNACALTID